MSKNEFIYVDFGRAGLYDGWLMRYCPEEHRIEWRDHYAVDRLSEERKREIEQTVLENWS